MEGRGYDGEREGDERMMIDLPVIPFRPTSQQATTGGPKDSIVLHSPPSVLKLVQAFQACQAFHVQLIREDCHYAHSSSHSSLMWKIDEDCGSRASCFERDTGEIVI